MSDYRYQNSIFILPVHCFVPMSLHEKINIYTDSLVVCIRSVIHDCKKEWIFLFCLGNKNILPVYFPCECVPGMGNIFVVVVVISMGNWRDIT